MRKFRRIGIGTVAATSLFVGIAASVAHASPEFGRCVKVANGAGAFANAGCTKPGGSAKYVWQASTNLGFDLALTSDAATFQAGTQSIACSSATGFGEYTATNKLANVHIADRGCEFSGTLCSSFGDELGEIASETLEGALGVISANPSNPAKNKVGLDLFPPAHSGPFFAEYLCGPASNTVTGSVIVPVKVNKMLMSSSLKYTTKRGAQKPEAFEGQARDVLLRSSGGLPAQAVGATLTLSMTAEEPIEIRAGVE